MDPSSLRSIFNEFGVSSVRGFFAATGGPEESLRQQTARALIGNFWRDHAGFRTFGLPVSDVVFGPAPGEATRQYQGGKITLQGRTPTGYVETVVRVEFLGFHCNQESTSDQLSGSDEPYFIIGIGGDGASKTMKFGPYDGVDTGTQRHEATVIVTEVDRIVPPISLNVVVMEHDDGTPEEAEAGVRAAIEDAERKAEQALGGAGLYSGGGTDNHVMPQWLRDIYIGWIPEWATKLLNLQDDNVGHEGRFIFDYDATSQQWNSPPVEGTFGDNPYNLKINVDGGDEGNYDVYFNVHVVQFSVTVT